MKKLMMILLAVLLCGSLVACSNEATPEETSSPTVTPEATESTVMDYSGIAVSSADYAAHGTRSFALVSAVVAGDVVLAAYIDEYQYLTAEDYTGVPNSDEAFGETMLAAGSVLGSKRANTEGYSAMMTEKGGATQTLDASWMAIEAYAVGKTVAELEEWVSTAEAGVDVVSGSTLVDTVGYVQAVIKAANQSAAMVNADATAEYTDVKVGKADYAAHGTRSFAVASVAVMGDVIVAAYIDEFQYLSAEDYTGVANSEEAFGETMLAEGSVLGSKRVNSEGYSAMMTEKGGATQTLDASWMAIEAYAVGKTVAELEEWVSTAEAGVDVVSGSTLVDTVGYIQAVIEAAKAAQ